jgi:hypothetical protein
MSSRETDRLLFNCVGLSSSFTGSDVLLQWLAQFAVFLDIFHTPLAIFSVYDENTKVGT